MQLIHGQRQSEPGKKLGKMGIPSPPPHFPPHRPCPGCGRLKFRLPSAQKFPFPPFSPPGPPQSSPSPSLGHLEKPKFPPKSEPGVFPEFPELGFAGGTPPKKNSIFFFPRPGNFPPLSAPFVFPSRGRDALRRNFNF